MKTNALMSRNMGDELINISYLPSEVIEYILSLVSPYKDLDACKLVCRKWLHLVRNVIKKHETRFRNGVDEAKVVWHSLPQSDDLFTTISRRYSHSACYYDKAMYVFGGCTSTNTTFNDLWKLNLSTMSWDRPVPTGSYPSPKACATLVLYKDSLVLYGGWTQSTPSPLHQVCHLFNELNVYRLKTNRWEFPDYSLPPPPSAAGHSATVHRDHMIVFGGIRRQLTQGQPSQEIVDYDLERNTWCEPQIAGPKPLGRYGQTQVALDDDHLLVIGGCGGPNRVFNDVWLLSMNGANSEWRWTELRVDGTEFSATHMWCSPGCKVDDRVVFLCKRQATAGAAATSHPAYASHYNISAQIRGRSVWVPPVAGLPDGPSGAGQRPPRRIDEPNINGRQGHLRRRQHQPLPPTPAVDPASAHRQPPDEAVAGPSAAVAAAAAAAAVAGANPQRFGHRPSVRPNAMRNRERQLEALRNMEERIHKLQKRHAEPMKSQQQPQSNTVAMTLCVLDISEALSERRVRWMKPSGAACRGSPEEAVLYSVVRGRSELIVFGGVQKFISTEATTNSPQNGGPNIVSNQVYFIRPPPSVI